MSAASRAENSAAEPVRKVTSVVRADSRTGRLVRTVVVTPKPVLPKAVAAASAAAEALNLEQLVDQAARAYDLDPALVHSIIKVESNYNTYAVSNKGAQGLMQLIPSTAQRFGVKNSFDAKENIDAGVRYYKYLRLMFGDDRLALAAYNAGEGAVTRYNFQIPPYPETINYVYQVGRNWGEARKKKALSQKPQVAAVTPPPPPLPEHPKLEQFQDDQGRLYIRTTRQ